MAMTSLTQNIKGKTLATEKGTSVWADAYIRLKKNKLAMLGGIVVILILILCFIIAPILAASGMNANEQDLTNRFAGVGEKGVLGTDQLGRDLFMRVLEGGQISLLVAIMATCMTVTIGVIYGGIAGYVGGTLGNTMMRIVDGLLAMPFLIIVILFREIITPYIDTLAKFLIDDWGWNDNTVLRFANLIPLTIAIDFSIPELK